MVGDLLYDTYLKAKKPTIDIKSDEFNIFSKNFCLCEFWIEYFKDNRIKAIITSILFILTLYHRELLFIMILMRLVV